MRKKFIIVSLLLLLSCNYLGNVFADWSRKLMDAYDIDQTEPTDGQALLWDDTTDLWIASDLASAADLLYLRLDGSNFPVVNYIGFNTTDYNTFIGRYAGKNIVSGAKYNTFVGHYAGYLSASSSNAADSNTAIGYNSQFSNISGAGNVSVGGTTLFTNTTGSANTSIGLSALSLNTTGNQNVAVGAYACLHNTTGSANTGVGYNALYNLVGGENYGQNVALGNNAAFYQADGSTPLSTTFQSVYIGAGAMGYNNSDVNSIVIGYNAIGAGANTVVLGNSSITATTLQGNVSGDNFISICADGTQPYAATSTTVNTNLNADLLDGQHGAYYATAADYLKLDGSNFPVVDYINFNNVDCNTLLGFQAGKNLKTGAAYNSFGGYRSGYCDAASTNVVFENVGFGDYTLFSLVNGWQNSAFGSTSLYSLESGRGNSGNGYYSLFSLVDGDFNTGNGWGSLQNNVSGDYNTADGYRSLDTVTGTGNTGSGAWTLANCDNTDYNSAFGYRAAMFQADGTTPLTTPSQSTYIGAMIRGFSNSDVNAIVIGYGAIGAGANTVVLGNANILTTYLKGAINITGATTINTNSTSALVVEQTGVKNNILTVDTTNGLVAFGKSTDAANNVRLEVAVDSNVPQQNMLFTKYGNTSWSPDVAGYKVRGSAAVPAPPIAGDNLIALIGMGYNGTGQSNQSYITITAAETYSATNQGSYMSFWNIPLASTAAVEHMRLDPSGKLGIGTITPGSLLQVGAGTALPNSIASFFATVNNYSQINNQNFSNGGNASTDYIATADNGSDTTYYVDLGINSSGYNNASYTITGANDSYLYANNKSLAIGTAENNAANAIKFHTGGTLAANERMRIDNSGNVGIGTMSPLKTFHVASSNTPISPALYSEYMGNAVFSGNISSNMGLGIVGASDTATNDRPIFGAIRSRGTLNAPTAVVSGDDIFSFLCASYDGSTLQYPAYMNFRVDNTVSSTHIPTKISFYTGTNSSDRAERLTIRSSGNVGLGTTTPTAVLHLKAGTATASTAPFKFTSGVDLTTAEAGAMEYDGTNLHFTAVGTLRENIFFGARSNGTLTSGTTSTITNANAKTTSTIIIQPTSAAITLLGVYVSTKNNGTFVLTHGVASGAESFDYLIIN